MKIKSKKLPIILGGLGIVAVSSIGFATWLIGYEKVTENKDLSVTVDTYEDHGLILECKTTDTNPTINLVDFKTTEETESSKIVVSENTAKLNVALDSFKLALSDNYYQDVTSIDFTVTVNQKGLDTLTYEVGAADPFKREAGAKTYLEFAHANIEMSKITALQPDTSTIDGWKVYDLTKIEGFDKGFSFNYGSLFENTTTTFPDKTLKTPAAFYNANLDEYNPEAGIDGNVDLFKKWSQASKELEAMDNAFKGQTINIKVDVKTTPKQA